VVKVLSVLFKGESVHVPNRVLNYCWRTKSAFSPAARVIIAGLVDSVLIGTLDSP
jgi:hypothetical protein